ALPILYQHPDFDGYLTGAPTQSTASSLGLQIIASGMPSAASSGTEWKRPSSVVTIAQNPAQPAYQTDESDSEDGEVWEYCPDQLKDRRDWMNPSDRPSATNLPNSISDPKSSVISPNPVAQKAQKALKKPGFKKCLALTLCLLPVALSAGFAGLRYLHHRSAKPEQLLPEMRTPLSQNYIQQIN
ncbi:CHAT domain-containing protein, partial [Microcoleus sp. herbarium8]